MSKIIKYGDTVSILNGHSNWQGGYLFATANLTQVPDRPGSRNDVVTAKNYNQGNGSACANGVWRVESGNGKAFGNEVMDGDVIYLHNLVNCDSGYLCANGTPHAGSCSTSPEQYLHDVNTADKGNLPPDALQWKINLANSNNGKGVTEGDMIHLTNQYNNSTGGFLDTSYNSPYSSTPAATLLYDVHTSNDAGRLNDTGAWKMTIVEDPCPEQNPPHKDGPCNGRCGGKCGDNPQGGRQCFTLPANTKFGLNALINSDSTQTIKVFIDDKQVDTLTGSGVGNINPGAKTYNSGSGKVCIEVWANGKMSPLRYADNPLDSKPGMAVIGTEDGHDNDYNDTIVVLNWGLN